MRSRIIAGNWKMNGSFELVDKISACFANQSTEHDVVVFPPAVYAHYAGQQFADTGVSVGLQNISQHESGAYTGELSFNMAAEVGITYTIIGHSERREYYAESDQSVAEKVVAALANAMTPVVCVGEDLATRENGDYWPFIEAQLAAVDQQVSPEHWSDIVIAYEPIWAIGTGKSASVEQAQEVHQLIREWLLQRSEQASQDCRILYGGSVNENNAAEYFSQRDIDGALIGGASLVPEKFLAIASIK